jgi:hypothetical protein
MTDYPKKLSYSVWIKGLSPSHVQLNLYLNMIPEEQDHIQATRALAGTLTLRNEELGPFLERTQPDFVEPGLEIDLDLLYQRTGVTFFEEVDE